jgi:hypothetical protein
MRPLQIEGRPPAGSRPRTQPSPASRDESIAPVTAQLDFESYQAELVTAARDAGLASAACNDAEWVESVLEWIYDLPAGAVVHADLVRSLHGPSRAAGPVFRTAAKRGVLEAVGLQESSAITRHKGLQRVWRRT